MTQEEKELLLKDLCGRLQSKVMIYLHTSSTVTGSAIVLNSSIYGFIEDVLNYSPYEIKEIKPYLRPMSSMTEEERKIISDYKTIVYGGYLNRYEEDVIYEKEFSNYLDFLNSRHLDYRGLIPMGFALEAPEDMYK